MTSALAYTLSKAEDDSSTTRVVKISAASPNSAFGQTVKGSAIANCLIVSASSPIYECY